jgi:hypothetical protein
MKTLIMAVALFALAMTSMTGCANVKYTLRDPGKNGDDIEVRYSGTAGGARELVNAATHRRDSVIAGDVAVKAVDKGMATSTQSTPVTTGTTASPYYPYGMYGAGYGYGFGPGAYGGQVMSPQTALSERVGLGYGGPGMLPPLSEPVYYAPPPPREVAPPQPGGSLPAIGTTTCPTDRVPLSIEERTACLEQDMKKAVRKIDKKKK